MGGNTDDDDDDDDDDDGGNTGADTDVSNDDDGGVDSITGSLFGISLLLLLLLTPVLSVTTSGKDSLCIYWRRKLFISTPVRPCFTNSKCL